MKENNCRVVITCRYHNGDFGYHTPVNGGESIIGIGFTNDRKKIIEIEKLTPHMKECEGRCGNCVYAKLYVRGKNGWKERNGRGNNYEIRIFGKSEIVSYKEIVERARDMEFPYV